MQFINLRILFYFPKIIYYNFRVIFHKLIRFNYLILIISYVFKRYLASFKLLLKVL